MLSYEPNFDYDSNFIKILSLIAILILIFRFLHLIKQFHISLTEEKMQTESLVMNVKSFGNIERIPKLSSDDKQNIVTLVKSKMTTILKRLPNFEKMDTVDTHVYLKDVSTELLHVIRMLRTVDKSVHSTIWSECSKDTRMM